MAEKILKIGVVGTPGGWSSENLADSVAERTGYRLLVEMNKVRLDVNEGVAWFGGINLMSLDALIVKKIGSRYSADLMDRLEILRLLHGQGLPIFSPPLSMLRVMDRLSCTISLRLADIPMPPTTITEDIDEALRALAAYGTAVFKPMYTSKARGMAVITHGPDAREQVAAYRQENKVLYIQKIEKHDGCDLGVAFLGGEYLTTYARCNRGDSWNTTTASGGKYECFEPSRETIEVARRAQAPFDLTFTCVDIIESARGPLVLEVSAFGGFRGIRETSGLDAAGLYADHVVKQITK
jgi:ribosomal protein S6--L-glutamate ligase